MVIAIIDIGFLGIGDKGRATMVKLDILGEVDAVEDRLDFLFGGETVEETPIARIFSESIALAHIYSPTSPM